MSDLRHQQQGHFSRSPSLFVRNTINNINNTNRINSSDYNEDRIRPATELLRAQRARERERAPHTPSEVESAAHRWRRLRRSDPSLALSFSPSLDEQPLSSRETDSAAAAANAAGSAHSLDRESSSTHTQSLSADERKERETAKDELPHTETETETATETASTTAEESANANKGEEDSALGRAMLTSAIFVAAGTAASYYSVGFLFT